MRKYILTLAIILVSLVFVGCSSETSDKEDIQLDQSEISDKLMQVVQREQKKQVEIINSQYNKLSSARQEEISAEEYYQELAVKYKGFTETALERFKQMGEDGDVEEMREQLRQEMEIPDWFWEMKETSNEIIREAALK